MERFPTEPQDRMLRELIARGGAAHGVQLSVARATKFACERQGWVKKIDSGPWQITDAGRAILNATENEATHD